MIKTLILATTFLTAGAGLSYAQDARVAPGTPAPNSPRLERNGDVSPAPSTTVTGGTGANEVGSGTPGQTKSGGPSGGKGNGGGS